MLAGASSALGAPTVRGATVPCVTVRGLPVLVLAIVTPIASGCGGSSAAPKEAGVHLDGKRVRGDYVFETDASGVRFLVPVPVLAGQGGQAFEVAAPTTATVRDSNSSVIVRRQPHGAIVADAVADMPHSAHVELLATGEPGLQIALSWTDTCGFTSSGHQGSGNNTGGQGIEVLRSPAVTLVKLPPLDGGDPYCHLGATAEASTYTPGVHLEIISY